MQGCDLAGDGQHGTGIQPGPHPEPHAAGVLQVGIHAVQHALEAAGQQQPDECAGQAATGEPGHVQQPVLCVCTGVQGGNGQRQFHPEHGAQDHAQMAGIEDQHRGR